MMTPHEQYQCVAESLALLGGTARREWKAAAAQAGLSPYYFQRVFRRHIGISPRQYAACLTLSDIKQRLAAGSNILDAAFDAGLSGGGRAHDLFISMDGTTPGQFMGGAVEIDYGCVMSPFGRVFIAATARGVSLLQFVDTAAAGAAAAGAEAALAMVRKQWPHATLRADDAAAKDQASLGSDRGQVRRGEGEYQRDPDRDRAENPEQPAGKNDLHRDHKDPESR